MAPDRGLLTKWAELVAERPVTSCARPLRRRHAVAAPRSAKTSGTIACSPSLLANWGESCTSIMTASAPAATAASDICGTNSRRPIPCVGSTTTGKMRFGFQNGDGVEIERVTRGVFEGANAAFAQEHIHVSFAQDVFGAHDQLADRRAKAALEQDGEVTATDLFQERKVLHVARADLQAIGVFLHHRAGLAASMISVMTGKPVSRRASARNRRPSSRNP